ncbi:helix-turn-helix domain-containing protein [Pseudomaricurvus alkylphenolicus]|uniref:AraC-like ligand-binding domain-containing protein n=1 Tax=Pseudomaricurvus alkylphenolicus TaxID=1306991 RepID=UPI00141D8061|nr:helix-turn-helix domain-containing protein [Pseudomaricurvus alkylphenolicus]NIB38504.1 helix-turn-helix domain-containing protein [Pseudomaricurvus alkylphenolicus]
MLDLVYDTSKIDQASQLEYWADYVCRTLTKLQINKIDHAEKGFRGRLSQASFGQISITSALAQESEVQLTREGIASADEEFLLMHLQYRGKSNIWHNGRELDLKKGDIEICDCTQPYRLRISGDNSPLHEMLVLRIPHAALAQRVSNVHELAGSFIDNSSDMGQLVSQFVINVWERRGGINEELAPQLGNQVLDLLSLALNSTGAMSGNAESAARTGHLVRMKRFIDDNLSDGALTPAEVAAAACISLRYAHKLFKDDGQSIAGYIMQRRLQQCCTMLSSGKHQGLTITEIAHMWGFKDASHFGHAFKREFAMSPRAYRMERGSNR